MGKQQVANDKEGRKGGSLQPILTRAAFYLLAIGHRQPSRRQAARAIALRPRTASDGVRRAECDLAVCAVSR